MIRTFLYRLRVSGGRVVPVGLVTAACIIAGSGFLPGAYAQGGERLAELSKQVIEEKDAGALYTAFEEIKLLYAQDGRYAELVDFLDSLAGTKKALKPYTDYYTAFARYSQLRYLEEKQLWDEYFSKGNSYRDEISRGAQDAIAATQPRDQIHLYARLILWQFHKDQQDSFTDESLSALMKAAETYARDNADINPLKDAADRLSGYGERGKARELYRMYVGRMSAASVSAEALRMSAEGFYQEGNIDLAQSVYDVYIARIASDPVDKMIPVLKEIALRFAYKEPGAPASAPAGAYDVVYAEKIFKQIVQAGGASAFDEELSYRRAYNAQMARDYPLAAELYGAFAGTYRQSKRAGEARFKAGMIRVYILRDIDGGRSYFLELSADPGAALPYAVSSLYQMGLLSQWKGDSAAAKSSYDEAVAKAGETPRETVERLRLRLQEIQEGGPMEYNLKTFLDSALKNESAGSVQAQTLELSCAPYRAQPSASVEVLSSAAMGSNGCFPVDLQYLWSGHTGSAQPPAADSGFTTTYSHAGTKEINLVVVSSAGIAGYAIDFIDIE